MTGKSRRLPGVPELPPSAVKHRRPYTDYIQADTRWVGRIPAHWKQKRLKFCTSVFSGGTPNMATPEYWGGDIPWVSPKDMYTQSITDTQDHITELGLAESSSRLIAPNALLMVVRSGILAHSIPVAINAVPVAINQDIRAVVPKQGLTTEFLKYLVVGNQHALLREWAKHGTTVQSIETHYLLNGLIPIPTLPEQHAIAAFLDRETAKIDALVEKKRRLIELLKEKRAAMISHAVTKGLNPDVPMKDSGIEWMGRIPEHWQLARIGHYCSVLNGSTPRKDNSEYWSGGDFPWLTSAKINEGVIREADQFVTDRALVECHLPVVPANSVLVAITGEGQTRGRAAFLEIESTISQHLACIAPQDARLIPQFILRTLQSQYEWLRLASSGAGSTRAALTCEYLKTLRIPLPPLSEQAAIVNHLHGVENRLGLLTQNVDNAIIRLLEYRTALISAAVTGKIDVRGEVAQ